MQGWRQALLFAASSTALWRRDAAAITLLYTRFLSLDLVLRRKSESGEDEASCSWAPNSFILSTPVVKTGEAGELRGCSARVRNGQYSRRCPDRIVGYCPHS